MTQELDNQPMTDPTDTKSKLFEGYKSVGLVSTHVPHIVRYIDKLSQTRVITVSNNTFLVFNHKLKLIETCISRHTYHQLIPRDLNYH
jgi:hypothetical protein